MTNTIHTDRSEVTISKGGITFTGDGITLYQAVSLKGALSMYAKFGMIPTRGVTITKMLKMASTFTGKTYKRGSAQQAADDMAAWVAAAKAAMPIRDER